MKKRYINIILFCMRLVLGFLLISLYNTSTKITDSDAVSEKKIDLLREELDKADAEKRLLNDKIDGLKEEISSLEQLFENNKISFEKLTDELNSYKILSGGFDVKGEGIIININENGEADNSHGLLYNYQNILSLISY